MKYLYTCLLTVFSYATTTAQNFYTVSNDPKMNANFSSLQSAHNAVAAGSTLYLMPSQKSYGDLTMTKRLNVYGTGFLINDNFPPNTQAAGGTAIVSSVNFRPGSSGSLIEGIELTESITLGGALWGISSKATLARFIFDSVSNITISRCYARTAENQFAAIFAMDSASNCLIKQCYLSIGVGFCPTVNGGTGDVPRFNIINFRSWATSKYKIHNVTFANNIFDGYAHCGAAGPFYLSYPQFDNNNTLRNQIVFDHNTFYGPTDRLEAATGQFFSNPSCTNITYTNNLFQNNAGPIRTAQFSSTRFYGTTNKNMATDTGFFAGTTGINAAQAANALQNFYANGSTSLDGLHQIQPGHAALTYATNGGEIGAFGGQYPFKLSGIPDYPYPFSVKVPAKATTGGTLPVRIKARAGNQ